MRKAYLTTQDDLLPPRCCAGCGAYFRRGRVISRGRRGPFCADCAEEYGVSLIYVVDDPLRWPGHPGRWRGILKPAKAYYQMANLREIQGCLDAWIREHQSSLDALLPKAMRKVTDVHGP